MVRVFLHIVFCPIYIGISLGFFACSSEKQDDGLVNVVLVLTDDQGWGDVGFHGNALIETPVIDSLANVGVSLDRFYVSPVCAPTRASLLTGKYHLSTGTSWVTHRKEVMRADEVTLAEILKASGYATACFGKWHNGAQYPHNPNGQGFETFFGFSAGHWNNYFDTDLEYNGTMVSTKGYLPDVLTDSVVSFIKQNAKQPFFAYVAYNTPHTPYQVPDVYFDKYKAKGLDDKTACIYGMCENIDDNVARIYTALENQGITDNTIFIFMSDNGPNYERYNGGFKGRKAQVDEGGVRVPFVIHFPDGDLINNRIESEFAAHIDILPTILGLANISLPDSLLVDGIDITALLQGKKTELPDRRFYTHHVIRKFDTLPGAVRSKGQLLTLTSQDTGFYNLIEDPYQTENLIEQHASATEEYLLDYKSWITSVTKKGLSPEPIEIAAYLHGSTILPAHEAVLKGGIHFFGKDGWANDWTIGNGTMSWDIKVALEGEYQVSVEYANTPEDIGSRLIVKCGDQTAISVINNAAKAPTIKSPDRVKRGEVYERQWNRLKIAQLYLSEGEQKLSLEIGSEQALSAIEIKTLIINKL